MQKPTYLKGTIALLQIWANFLRDPNLDDPEDRFPPEDDGDERYILDHDCHTGPESGCAGCEEEIQRIHGLSQCRTNGCPFEADAPSGQQCLDCYRQDSE